MRHGRGNEGKGPFVRTTQAVGFLRSVRLASYASVNWVRFKGSRHRDFSLSASQSLGRDSPAWRLGSAMDKCSCASMAVCPILSSCDPISRMWETISIQTDTNKRVWDQVHKTSSGLCIHIKHSHLMTPSCWHWTFSVNFNGIEKRQINVAGYACVMCIQILHLRSGRSNLSVGRSVKVGYFRIYIFRIQVPNFLLD